MHRRLERVTAADGYAHLWSHVWDLANDAQWPQVEAFLRRLANRRGSGGVVTKTMAELRPEAKNE